MDLNRVLWLSVSGRERRNGIVSGSIHRLIYPSSEQNIGTYMSISNYGGFSHFDGKVHSDPKISFVLLPIEIGD